MEVIAVIAPTRPRPSSQLRPPARRVRRAARAVPAARGDPHEHRTLPPLTAVWPRARKRPRRSRRPPRGAAPPPTRPRERPAWAGLLLTTLLLYVWDLSREGWADPTTRWRSEAGTHSWSVSSFGSLDSSNSITVDEPPSLWPLGSAARVSASTRGASAAAGDRRRARRAGEPYLIAAPVVHRSRRALIAPGAVLAATPAAALMFRYDSPDAMPTCCWRWAPHALVRAIEAGLHGMAAGGGAMIGLALRPRASRCSWCCRRSPWCGSWSRRERRTAASADGRGGRRRCWSPEAGGSRSSSHARVLAPHTGGNTDDSGAGLVFGYNGLDR